MGIAKQLLRSVPSQKLGEKWKALPAKLNQSVTQSGGVLQSYPELVTDAENGGQISEVLAD